MPERFCSAMNLYNPDLDCKVPTLEMELEELSMDIALRVQRIQEAESLSSLQDPVPLPLLAADIVRENNNHMQSSSIAGSTHNLIRPAHDLDLLSDFGTFSPSNGSIPIYQSSGSVSNGYSHLLNEACYIPQEQPMLHSADDNFASLFSGLLGLDVECTSQNPFTYHATTQHSATNDGEMQYLGPASTTPAVFKIPANPRTPPKKQPARRQRSCPSNDSIDDLMQVEPFKAHQSNQGCYNTRPRSHRKTPSESNITLFTGEAYLPVSLSTDSTFYPQQQQHHISRPTQRHIGPRGRSKSLPKKKPYTHREATQQIKMIPTMLAASGTQYISNQMVQSQSVPSSPSITGSQTQQQLNNSLTSFSNFTYDHTMSSSSGLSNEMRDEQEKTEAFNRLHQGLHLWEFLLEVLLSNDYQPILKWTDKENGIFKVVDSEALAKFWGDYRRKPKMTYDKMSRAIRYYYGKDILDKGVTHKRLHYQFKYHSHWWEKLQKVDSSFKISHIPESNIPPPNAHDMMIADDNDIVFSD